MAEVSIEKLTKSYDGSVKVLDGVDLHINQGELVFLLGPSGCGKSTLLRILAGLVSADSGSISFDGQDIMALPPEKRRAAMVFQNYALWPHLNVFENVAFGLRMEKAPKKEIEKRVMESLEQVQMTAFAKGAVTQLSGGQQQRVALARALAVDPALLLLDEPLSNLAANLRDLMRREIKRICAERRLTALYVTHDRREALSMADRAGVMHKGKLTCIGTPDEIYNHPGDGFTARFLGDVNVLPCGSGIRPERVRISSSSGKLRATLLERSFFGDSCEWLFDVPGSGKVIVKELAAPARTIGKEYFLDYDDSSLIPVAEPSDEE
jgi:iron(III) transport system ATP-binding protein